MFAKRIIPCLDLRDGKVVKGVNFENIRELADPIDLARHYNDAGADELVILDIASNPASRKKLIELIGKISLDLSIPIIVGGGIASTEDAFEFLIAGADKVSINSAAVRNPQLVKDLADRFSCDKLVVAIDVKKDMSGDYTVRINGGKTDTGINALEWAREVSSLGAGQILLTSMDKDGTKSGFDLDITSQIAMSVPIPIIASGGAGKKEDFLDVFTRGRASAALAASIFHFGQVPIPSLKEYLGDNDIKVNI